MNHQTAQTTNSLKQRTLDKYGDIIEILEDGAGIKIAAGEYGFDPSPISDDEVISLLHPNVKKIELYCTEITDKTIISIAEICHEIKDITVWDNDNLTEESLKAIGTKCKRLERFIAVKCPNLFTEKGVEYLSGCELMTYLRIWSCGELSDNLVELIVKSFPKLEELDLTYCDITSLPKDIDNHLKCLKKLWLYNNKLTKLPRSITNLADTCKDFGVDGNPLQEPPIEIANQGLEAIKRYFEELDRGATISTQQKVVLLGNWEAGKTSLRNAIKGRRPVLTDKDDRTIYLDLESIVFSLEETNLPYHLITKFYDCGGQQDYAVGQAPFITKSSVLVLVVPADNASDEHYEEAILRFLVLFQIKAPGGLVQLVLSKVDLISETERDEKIKWLLVKVNETLAEWSQHAVNRSTQDPTESHARGKSVQPLRVAPDVISISVKDDDDDEFGDNDSRTKMMDAIVRLVQDKQLPTVGQSIPKSWLMQWRLFDAVSRYGADADEEKLFEAARSEDSRPFSDETRSEMSPSGACCAIEQLRTMWDRFCKDNQDVEVTETTFDDALRLLDAQGSVFVDAGLVFLRPSLVTELLRPLIDHRLTPEFVETDDFEDQVEAYVRLHHPTDITPSDIRDAVLKLARRGELDMSVLPFLWRNVEGLDPAYHDMLIKMLIGADVIFKTSNESGPVPMVLFRLPAKPPSPEDLERIWPEKLPSDQQQLELHVRLWAGCPPSLAAHFAAKAQSLGHCKQACLYGTVVIDKDDDDRLIRCERVKIGRKQCLVMSVREAVLGVETLRLLRFAVEFVEQEKEKHLPGLSFELRVPCPRCISRGRHEDAHMFQWKKDWEKLAEGGLKKLFCDKCDKSIWVQVGADGRKEIRYPEVLEERKEFESCRRMKHSDHTTLLRDNTEEDVGVLSLDNVDNPSQKWPMSATPYVFLSHTGQDGVKEDIARPTHWFLTKVLEVEAFVDDLNAIPGEQSVETLMPPAYKCTDALVILSRSFRERRFCVRELNTFMARWHRRDGIRVVPVLWQINKLNGYHPDVEELSYIASKESVDAADFMVYTLWPKVLRALDRPPISTELLQDHLFQYVESHRGEASSIPSCLERFAARHGIVRERLH